MPLEEFKERNPGLRLMSTGVTLPSDKTDKTPLDYFSCVSEAFKRIKKGSSYYRIILLTQQMTKKYNNLQEQAGKEVRNNSKERLCKYDGEYD